MVELFKKFDLDVRALSFTGSTSVGQYLYRESANSLKKLGLELGGNAPFIVFNDANLEDAVNGVIASKFRNSGQTCICANRILVQSDVYKSFVTKLTDRVRSLKVSYGLDEDCDIGPLINADAVRSCDDKVQDVEIGGGSEVRPFGKALGLFVAGNCIRLAGTFTNRRF